MPSTMSRTKIQPLPMKALGALVLYQLWKFFVCCNSNEEVTLGACVYILFVILCKIWITFSEVAGITKISLVASLVD